MTVSAPLFSVVIPTYNRARLLDETLLSVAQQHFTAHEIIVVDDGSTDATQDVVDRHAPGVTFVQQAQHGPGAARNAGARRASGDYLAFLDSDDVWFPWTLELYAQAITQHGAKPAFVAGAPKYFSTREELTATTPAPLAAQRFTDYYASSEQWRWWGASAFVVRRDVFEAAGGFTDQWINGEDADFAMRIGVVSGFVHVTSPPTFGYRQHADTAMGNFDRTLAGAWHVIEKERADAYPGGAERAAERRRILGRHLRSVMLEAARQRLLADAWKLYRATIGWHVALGQWRFLFGFPLMALHRAIRG